MDAPAAPAPPVDGEAALLAALATLRSQGAARLDPVRFHYMEVLSQRMQDAPGEVRRLLQDKLQQALAGCGERLNPLPQVQPAQPVAGNQGRHRTSAQRPAAPLAQLNRYIQTVTHGATQKGTDGGPASSGQAARPELKSAYRFREAWSRMCAEDQVDLAVGRGPENAGPLNSHMLVLRSLALMRSLSPDYLRRFLSQVDALLWLEQANNKNRQMAAKPRPARPGRAKKR